MMKSTNTSLMTGIVEIFLLGLSLCVNPDFFFNPITGIFRSVSYLTEEAILIPRSKLDDLTYYSMGSYGIGCLIIGGMSLLSGQDRFLKKEILRAKLWLAALSSYVFIHAAFVYDLVGIDKTVAMFWSVVAIANTLWALSENRRFSKRLVDGIPRTEPTPLELATVAVNFVFCGLWGASLMWNPQGFEPATGNPLGMMKATPKDDNTWMDVQLFTVRMEGVPIMVFTLCMLELLLYDPSVQAIRANNKFALFGLVSYSLYFVRMALWCEYADMTPIAINLLSNVGMVSFMLQCGPDLFDEGPARALANHLKDVLKPAEPVSVAPEKAKKAN